MLKGKKHVYVKLLITLSLYGTTLVNCCIISRNFLLLKNRNADPIHRH